MRLNSKEMRVLSIMIASWGIVFTSSGFVMQSHDKPIVKTKYSLQVETKKIAEAQAKSNEIKLKDIEIEINNPISVDIKDYLENIENISEETLSILKLDTSLVNINEAGTYQYTITYKKKKYIGNVKVKAKELPNVTFTLKNLTLTIGDSLSTNPKSYINEEISDEVLNNLILDLSQVNNQIQGNYKYYITYKITKYEGEIYIRDPGPIIITPSNDDTTTPEPSTDDKQEKTSS